MLHTDQHTITAVWVHISLVADHPLELQANVVTPASPYLEVLGEVDYYCENIRGLSAIYFCFSPPILLPVKLAFI